MSEMRNSPFVLCVDGVYIKDGKILLLKRAVKPFKGCWHLTGGHVEENETLKDALKREFREETGLEIEAGQIVDQRIERTYDRTKIISVFEVTHARGKIRLNHESLDYGWFVKTPPNSVYNYDEYLSRKHRTGGENTE